MKTMRNDSTGLQVADKIQCVEKFRCCYRQLLLEPGFVDSFVTYRLRAHQREILTPESLNSDVQGRRAIDCSLLTPVRVQKS